MASKRIYINNIKVGYANKVELSPDITNAEPVKTFDGGVPNGSDDVSWSVTIDKLRYGKISDYKTMETLLLSMFKTPYTISIIEEVIGVDGTIKVQNNVYKCILTDKKYSIDVESNTVENLSFTGAYMREYINGEQIGEIN